MLKDMVTSPGGTAMRPACLERSRLRAILMDAVEVATARSGLGQTPR
jgi:pyrroline-5-carboxylate reductase